MNKKEISNKKDNFFRVHPSFFPHLPVGSTILIADKEWFVKKHNKTSFIIENQLEGADNDYEYKIATIQYNADILLWKKYDTNLTIELRLIYNSLAEKDERIRELETQVNSLIETVEKLGSI